jgi:hypothetical protein
VKREGAVNLKIGGPLSNSVSASRQGSQLNLAHTIVGIDGSPYRFPVQVQENPPEFTIFLGAKKVAADRFSYG